MAIPFTRREMEKAWRENKVAAGATPPSNAHRLLLFYAVECGLKAILMKRQKKERTDFCENILTSQHNLNRLLDCLSAQSNLRLPKQLNMEPIRVNHLKKDERKVTPGELNQMWRYGGYCSGGMTDQDLANKLLEISSWIDGELNRL